MEIAKNKILKYVFAILTVLLLSFIIYVCYIITNRTMNYYALFEQSGTLSSGKFLDFRIREKEQLTIEKLKKYPFSLSDFNKENRCGDGVIIGDRFIQAYDSSWRNGVLCFGFTNGKLSTVSWRFSLVA